jgi:hypothetical protein
MSGRVRDCGWAEASTARVCREGLATISASEIDRIEVRRFSWGHTAAAGVVGAGIVAAILSQVEITVFSP